LINEQILHEGESIGIADLFELYKRTIFEINHRTAPLDGIGTA
jgi:hypothetical protein